MTNDWELLQEFARRGSEEAFRAMVERYAGLVYSAALRQTADAFTAEDITQTEFVILARKAESLRFGTILPGWLFQTTRRACADAAKAARRRRPDRPARDRLILTSKKIRPCPRSPESVATLCHMTAPRFFAISGL
jgi:DNA-directed RNA polymerase specialized sigma24 family protein